MCERKVVSAESPLSTESIQCVSAVLSPVQRPTPLLEQGDVLEAQLQIGRPALFHPSQHGARGVTVSEALRSPRGR